VSMFREPLKVRCSKLRYYSDLELDGISRKSLKVSFQRCPLSGFSCTEMPVYNMIVDIKHCAEDRLQEDTERKKYTYPVRVNENMAVGLFKDKLTGLLIESDDTERRLLFMELQTDMEKYFLPVRKSESHEWKFHPTDKYMNNIKPAF
jgi:hypothetical protein